MRSLLALGLAWIFVQASPFRAESRFKGLLPESVREEILERLEKISWEENSLSRSQGALFVSGESYSPEGRHILNRIHFFPDKRWDVWVMRQSPEGKGFHFSAWSLLAIVVDKAAGQAYYLELEPEGPRPEGLPRPVRFTAACYTCHASGPRVIRPMRSGLAPALTGAVKARIGAWNRVIANYRIVETYKPRFGGDPSKTPIDLSGPFQNEPLARRGCVECHDRRTGVRAPLLRQHRNSIEALVLHASDESGFYVDAAKRPHAFMPLDAFKLSQEERGCLFDWLARTSASQPPRTGCDEKGEVLVSGAREFVVDSAASELSATARSTFGPIGVSHMLLSGSVSCAGDPPSCGGEIRADLRGLRTGIGLRDRHLKDNYLRVEREPFAVASIQEFRIPAAEAGEFTVSVRLRLAGAAVQYPASLKCARVSRGYRCQVSKFRIDLEKHGIAPPGFLGAAVEPGIDVAGEILLSSMPQQD